jgi:tetratricopeptide (TPR) repeat protein
MACALVLGGLVLVLFQLLSGMAYQQGLKAIEQGDLAGAAEPLGRAVRYNPGDLGPYFYRAIAQEARGDLTGAERSYRDVLKQYPAFMNAWYNLGNLYKERAQSTQAEEAYLRAVEIKPDFAEAHANLGNLYFDLAGVILRDPSYKLQAGLYYSKAQLEFQKAIVSRPGFVEAHYNLGILYYTVGKTAAARAEWGEALKYDPEYAPARVMLDKTGEGRKRKSSR